MTLDLTLEQINVIMQALGNAPYIQVVSVVESIKQQAAVQLAPAPETP
jgi:hypothetical protein